VVDVTGDWDDDERVLGWLAEARREADAVSADFVEAGKAAYGWHDVDAELGRLAHDSALAGAGASVRAGPGARRTLTFESSRFTIELELDRAALQGQLVAVPPVTGLPGDIEVEVATGERMTVPVDGYGYFALEPVPGAPFRLRCRPPGGSAAVRTGWITP
jgi:hypothetical protein